MRRELSKQLGFEGVHTPVQIVQGSDLGSELKRAGNYATGSPRRVTELP